jgi:hypothetical protein
MESALLSSVSYLDRKKEKVMLFVEGQEYESTHAHRSAAFVPRHPGNPSTTLKRAVSALHYSASLSGFGAGLDVDELGQRQFVCANMVNGMAWCSLIFSFLDDNGHGHMGIFCNNNPFFSWDRWIVWA